MLIDNSICPEGAALVVGGSGGIGQGISRELAANGVPVWLTYNSNQERADTLAQEIRDAGGQAESAQLTLQDLDSINRCVDSLLCMPRFFRTSNS